MAFKTAQLEKKADGTEVLIIEGFASTPTLDSYDDIVEPTAFKDTMVEYMKNPVILYRHNMNLPIGKCLEYKIIEEGADDQRGLYVKVEVNVDYEQEKVFANILAGNLKGFSIGYYCTKWEMREEGTRMIRVLKGLTLKEISVVSIPAEANSLFTLKKALKSFFGMLEKKAMEESEKGGEEPPPNDNQKPPEEGAGEAPAGTAGNGNSDEVKALEKVKMEMKEALIDEVKALMATEVKTLTEAMTSFKSFMESSEKKAGETEGKVSSLVEGLKALTTAIESINVRKINEKSGSGTTSPQALTYDMPNIATIR